ncbi:hypothetical protein CLF_102151 [Clonorchis sinensis]|uniref:Uncharacterized protein n=1 Tax=Clonorchis sinensis TaxID=79923 RepID=G7Y7D4_CLOSI|nr:hypothetical protein CLF_102151 [Clonorchis sinensis]
MCSHILGEDWHLALEFYVEQRDHRKPRPRDCDQKRAIPVLRGSDREVDSVWPSKEVGNQSGLKYQFPLPDPNLSTQWNNSTAAEYVSLQWIPRNLYHAVFSDCLGENEFMPTKSIIVPKLRKLNPIESDALTVSSIRSDEQCCYLRKMSGQEFLDIAMVSHRWFVIPIHNKGRIVYPAFISLPEAIVPVSPYHRRATLDLSSPLVKARQYCTSLALLCFEAQATNMQACCHYSVCERCKPLDSHIRRARVSLLVVDRRAWLGEQINRHLINNQYSDKTNFSLHNKLSQFVPLYTSIHEVFEGKGCKIFNELLYHQTK